MHYTAALRWTGLTVTAQSICTCAESPMHFKALDRLHTCCRFGLHISSEPLSSTFVYPTATGTAPPGLLHVWDSWVGILSFQSLAENLPRRKI